MSDRKGSTLSSAATLVDLFMYGWIGSTPYKVPASLFVYADFGAQIAASTAKTTPVDADHLALSDSAASDAGKKLSWANLKATLKTYFDGFYSAGGMTLLGTITTTSGTTQPLTNIPSGYKSLRLLFRGVSASGTFGLTLALSSTNGGAYGAAVAITTGTSINIARGVYGVIDIFGYTEAVTGKAISGALVTDNSVLSLGTIPPGALTNTAAACNALRIGTDAGSLDAGSVEVYGVK